MQVFVLQHSVKKQVVVIMKDVVIARNTVNLSVKYLVKLHVKNTARELVIYIANQHVKCIVKVLVI